MAIADAVPGVSGGTIGFVLGFYDNFITSLHNILSKDKTKRISALKYLLKLGIGWLVGFVLSMLVLKTLFQTHAYVMCSAFIGLTIAAIPFMIITEWKNIKGKYYNLVWTLIGAALVIGITLLRDAPFMDFKISFVDGLHGWQYLYVFIVGFVAISAMMLPGISGSTVMLIMGIYIPAITAAHEALHFNIPLHMILGLLPMGAGLVIGILLSVKGIKTAFEKHRSATVYCVIGMIIASVYAIAMAPPLIAVEQGDGSYAFPYEPLTLMFGKSSSLNIVAFLAGAAVIIGLELLRMRVEKKGRISAEGDYVETPEGESIQDTEPQAEISEAEENTAEDAASDAAADPDAGAPEAAEEAVEQQE
ncbi:MAG: DUF368 domain-containing protein [Clostridia bacterium]|nr:DUF368 domain-containing protein [Clostridia bacterium]